MDVRDMSEETAPAGDDLKLTNRLSKSRSPYVSANATLYSVEDKADMDIAGSRTHEQPGRVADVGPGSNRAGEEVESTDLHKHWICSLSLYAQIS